MIDKKLRTAVKPEDVTPYDQRGRERRKGDRRKGDRRTGRDRKLAMRLYRFLRSHLLHLPETERCLPDRRKGERRHPDDSASTSHRPEGNPSLLTQEEIQFLLKGGLV